MIRKLRRLSFFLALFIPKICIFSYCKLGDNFGEMARQDTHYQRTLLSTNEATKHYTVNEVLKEHILRSSPNELKYVVDSRPT